MKKKQNKHRSAHHFIICHAIVKASCKGGASGATWPRELSGMTTVISTDGKKEGLISDLTSFVDRMWKWEGQIRCSFAKFQWLDGEAWNRSPLKSTRRPSKSALIVFISCCVEAKAKINTKAPRSSVVPLTDTDTRCITHMGVLVLQECWVRVRVCSWVYKHVFGHLFCVCVCVSRGDVPVVKQP